MTTTMTTLRAPEVRTFPVLEFREANVTESGRFLEGRAVPYNTWADIGWFQEQHAPGSFARSITEAAKGLPLLLWHNNQTFPIGVSEQWDDNAEALDGVWRLDSSEEAERGADLAEKGMLTGMSIGFAPIRSEWEYTDDWDPDLGPEHQDRVTRHESRLLEVSLTPTPAFAGAQVSLVRSRSHRRTEERKRTEFAAWQQYRESIRRPA